MNNFHNAADTTIVALACAGDSLAFEELVRRQQSQIRNLLRRLCNDNDLADDLAQQTFIQAWKGLKRLNESSAFNNWLKQIAINTWLQYARKKDPFNQQLINADNELENSSAPTSHHHALDLNTALAQLPADVRLCIVLAYQLEMSHREIYDLTQLPLGTIKSHIKRGGEKLKQLLSVYGEK